jgi:hypothetical protein
VLKDKKLIADYWKLAAKSLIELLNVQGCDATGADKNYKSREQKFL